MRSFRILTDAFLLHMAQTPLIVLGAVCLTIIVITAVLVRRELRRSPSQAETSAPTEDTPCC